MADPDEALIEAIAEALCGLPKGECNTAYVHREKARAAYAAIVARLGLVEQFGTDDHGDNHEWADEQFDEASARRIAADDPYLTVVHRFVSRWVEVDHGSE